MDDYQDVCYLIHFEKPLDGSGVQHYLGFAPDLRQRIEKHRKSKGARLTARANHLGIGWRVVRVWRGADWKSEKYLKGLGASNLCPHCSRFMRNLPSAHVSVEEMQGRPSPIR